MAGVNYERTRKTVERMVNKYGRNITLINDQGPADPTKPLGPAASSYEVTTKGVFVRPSGYIKLGESFYMDPGMWQEAEKIALVLPSLTHDFARFTRVRDIDGQGFKLYKVEELRPGDLPLLVYIGMKQ
jgi:hypothetical protein